ncbi:hypothetical protein [Enterococcus sp. AZ072]|uniref:hypothetical protein n=1 Tax=unclassified Enterococcus TaxID=2608891 RepID=UPI003D2D1755
MELLYKYDVKHSQLKKELMQQVNNGDNPFKVALFAATQIFLSIVNDKKYIDDEEASDFYHFLYNMTKNELSPKANYEGETAEFFDLLVVYYLLVEHVDIMRDFPDTVCWVPGLTPSQRRIMLTWPKTFVLSLFEVKQQGETIVYRDLNTRKLHDIDLPASNIHLTVDENKQNTVLALLVPIGKTYLSTQPIFYPIDDFTFADIKWMERYKAKGFEESCFYGDDLLSSYYRYSKQKNLCMKNTQATRSELEDLSFYPANRVLRETDQVMAQRLLKQHVFFHEFEHYAQAEKLLTKVISTFPQMFHSYANALDLTEALRLLFVGEKLTAEDLRDSSDEVSIFWYTLICQNLEEDVRAIEAYIVPELTDNPPF